MEIDILRAELERLFELEELTSLSQDLLGYDPAHIGGASAKGSFVRALIEYCTEQDAVEALCDAVVASRPEANSKLSQLQINGISRPEELETGESFGDYLITRKLGAGPTGICYAARLGERTVRLKVLRAEATRDRRGLNRLLTLTRLAAGVSSPSLPRSLGTGVIDGRYYIAHEYVDGTSLAARIAEQGPLHLGDARPILSAVLQGLDALHGHRLTHCNLKLENVLLGGEAGTDVLLVDAGADRLRTRAPINGRIELLSVSAPATISPEQLRGLQPTPKSDLYSFGALMFEVLTGRPVFSGHSPMETAVAHLTEAPPAPSSLAPKGWIATELDDFVLALLDKDPEQRPDGGASELAAHIARMGRPSLRPEVAPITEAQLAELIGAVKERPGDEGLALDLEEAIDRGADPLDVANAFMDAAATIQVESVETSEQAAPAEPEAGEGVDAASRETSAEHADTQATVSDTADAATPPATEAEALAASSETPSTEAAEADSSEAADAELDGVATALARDASSADEETSSAAAQSDLPTSIAPTTGAELDDGWDEPDLTAPAPPTAVEAPARPPAPKPTLDSKQSLLHRAARIYRDAGQLESSEAAYAQLLEIAPQDETAVARLDELRQRLGKYEELVESLLERAERADSGDRRADVMAKIGRLYEEELTDPEQALVAYTQALCESPSKEDYARAVEKLAGTAPAAWTDVLEVCADAASTEAPPELKNPLLARMGGWYGKYLARPDLALHCFNAILATDPAHEPALEGLSELYRTGQQWAELGSTLLRRADASADPARARDLRCAAAELLETRLNDTVGARQLYTEVVEADPGHARAAQELGRMLERSEDYGALARLLERRAAAVGGDERVVLLNRIAAIHEDYLGDPAEAIRRYQAVLDLDGTHLDALRGLDRLFSKTGQFQSLLDNLAAQLRVAPTPRQRIATLERIASIHDEEFLDHTRAAEALERVLDIDPSHEPSLANLARHYRALDRWQDLTDLYERHIQLTTDEGQRLQLTLARAHVLNDQLGRADAAIEAFERALELAPEHAGALESLARLRETVGQEDAALKAIETLAENAETAEAKTEQYLRAARLLEQRGDRDAAIERYKKALDANPDDSRVSVALRTAYIERGDINTAIELLEREFERTEGDRQKAHLSAEVATLARLRLKDDERAEKAAKRALDCDPTEVTALTILGDLAFESQRYVEAVSFYERLTGSVDTLEHDDAVRLLVRFVDALSKGGSTEKALAPMDTLLRLAPDDAGALQRVAQVTFEHGSPKRARELYQDLFDRLGDRLDERERADATYRLGEAARRAGDAEGAIPILESAADLNPSSVLPLVALEQAYEAVGDWKSVAGAKTRRLDLLEGDDRVHLLVELGELAATRLDDRALATKSLVAAVDERPDDRKLLTRLMQLYSEEKDWSRLIDVVVKLAEFVDEPKQKGKYLLTAAQVAAREVGDYDQALGFLAQVRELDPDNENAIDESIEFLKDKGDEKGAVELLKEKAKRASELRQTDRMLDAFMALGVLYKNLGRIGHSIDAYEAAQTLDPENVERNELLAELYASDPHKYLGKAVTAQVAMLRQNPYREQSYKVLRRMYTETKRADPAWCLCQALYVLKLSEPDEERFFRRMRSEDPAYAQEALSDEDWLTDLIHPDADPGLTSVFALIEPAVIASRSTSYQDLGYDPRYAIEPSQHPYPLSQTLHYAAGVLGMELPPTFENSNDPGGLSFLHAEEPSIVLGRAALTTDIHPQAAAFIAARHIAYYRPGLYLRQLVPWGTGLRSWLFAAIKTNVPQFPVATDIVGPVNEATATLEQHLSPGARDHLARVVSKLLQSGRALDLKKWVQGVDLTADRIGFLLAHDLETAVEIIRASDENASSLSAQQRLKELVLFAISESYFRLREHLVITVDA